MARARAKGVAQRVCEDNVTHDWTNGKPEMLVGELLSMFQQSLVATLIQLLSHDHNTELDPNLKGAEATNNFVKVTCDDPDIPVEHVQADSGASLKESTPIPAVTKFTWARPGDFNVVREYVDDPTALFG